MVGWELAGAGAPFSVVPIWTAVAPSPGMRLALRGVGSGLTLHLRHKSATGSLELRSV